MRAEWQRRHASGIFCPAAINRDAEATGVLERANALHKLRPPFSYRLGHRPILTGGADS